MQAEQLYGIAIALLGGAAVGVEREHSGHAVAHFGGIRTFTLLGLLSGIAGWMWDADLRIPAAILLTAAAALVVTGYFAASRVDVDGTTEVAAVVVLGAGVLAGVGQLWLGGGLIAITALLLMEKTRLHAMVASIDDASLRAGFRFAVMAIVILPLLPAGPYGPFGGVKPRELWILVLFFSGLNFLGYVSRRLAGAENGYVVAGALGGLLSSTNVTLTFSRGSRTEGGLGGALAVGVLAASAVAYVRMTLATFVLNADVGLALWPYLVAPFVTVCAAAAVGRVRMTSGHATLQEQSNPLNLKSALQIAGLFQIVMFAIHLVSEYGGNRGVLVSGAVLGLTDVDALLVSMSRAAGQTLTARTAAEAIAVGALSNMLMKLALVLVLGKERFRWLAGAGLAAAAAVSILAFGWVRVE